jgi:hypothetical protein
MGLAGDDRIHSQHDFRKPKGRKMTTTDHRPAAGTSLGADVLYAAKYYLGGRRSLVLAGSAAAAAGLAFNWSWLAAAGIAPLLLSVLPCVAMCALGLCMSRMTGGSCSKETASVGNTETTPAPVAIQAQTEKERNITNA